MDGTLGVDTACRAEEPSPVDSTRWLPAAMFVLFLVGYFAAGTFVRHVPVAHRFDSSQAEFGIWTTLMGGIGGFALAAAAYFACSLAGVFRLAGRFGPGAIAQWVATVLLSGGAVLAALFRATSYGKPGVDRSLAIQTRPITVAAALCMGPGLVGFMAVRALALRDDCWKEAGSCRMRLVIRLRSELRRLLIVLGAFLTLIVVATGMRRRALLAFDPRLRVPREGVLLYGLIFAVLLGLFFIAASSAVDQRAGQLLDEFAPLPDPSDPSISNAMGRRDTLAKIVGVGDSWRTFGSVVVVAAPLLTALIGSATGT